MKAPVQGERSEQCPEFFKNVKGLPIRTHFQKHSPLLRSASQKMDQRYGYGIRTDKCMMIAPMILFCRGPSEEDVRNAAEAGAKRFEAHKAYFLEKITEEASKCINATNLDPSGIVAAAIKNLRYCVLAGAQIVKSIASTPVANEFPPGTLTANDWDLYHATEKCTSGETWKLNPKKNFKVTNKCILGQHDLSVPVNVVTGKNLSLEALVSDF
jgi:hypothetical protein